MKFSRPKTKRSTFKTYVSVLILIILVLLVITVAFIRKSYSDNLKPVSSKPVAHFITVDPGSTTSEIADTLLSKGIIRSDWAFEWYVRNHQVRDELKAGTFLLYENQSVGEIVDVLVSGKEATDVVTIFPGNSLKQVREELIKKGFKAADVDAALEPTQYAGHAALTDKPAAASLEGYLYPETFQKTANTTPKQIITQSLDEMQKVLTPNLRQAFSKKGLTLHQAITLSSVIEKEVSDENPADRPQVAQVFLKRYNSGMKLESDPTAFYGATLDGKERSLSYDSPYNTYIHVGLPAGPISNVSKLSLESIANPAQTDWTYFVAGDDGKTHFSKTLQEHEENTQKYCTAACGN